MYLSEIVAWGALAVSLVLLVLFVVQTSRVSNLERRYRRLTGDSGARTTGPGMNLEEMVAAQGQRLERTTKDLLALSNVVDTMEKSVQTSIQNVGMVRYNPFQETGGDQSFALALLDAQGDGIVISSLHSRTVTRFYAKPIKAGASQLSLSTEEAKAVQTALSDGKVKNSGRPK